LSSRPVIETLQARGDLLDAAEFRRQGLLDNRRNILRPGIGPWRWSQAIEIEASRQCLTVRFRNDRLGCYPIIWKQAGIHWRPHLQCNCCGVPRKRLYSALGTYACRLCIGARYRVKLIGNEMRVRNKRTALLAQLGMHHDCGGVVRKPKWMRRHTFQRIRYEVEQIEHRLSTRWRRSHSRLTWRITPSR
jgi:hypothetical protein